MSADGSSALIGAQGRANVTGAAYVFQGRTWKQKTVLTASDGAYNDYFSWSLAVSSHGSTIVNGAIGHKGGGGAAYIFTKKAPGTPEPNAAAARFLRLGESPG